MADQPRASVVDDFPILCEPCLGTNPCIRMSKETMAAACKICMRPQTIYRWRPGGDHHLRQTECCQMCAKVKNVCQTCMLDLEYMLPAQVRDAVLDPSEVMSVPVNAANREYLFEQYQKRIEMAETGSGPPALLTLPYGQANPATILDRLESKKTPYRKRDIQNICRVWVETDGQCPRGSSCPYRHEAPLTDKTDDEELTRRYRMTNLPRTDPNGIRLPPILPQDKTLTTLFIGGGDETISDQDLLEHFSKFGPISSIRTIPSKSIAFLEFAERSAAELAIAKTYQSLTIRSLPLRVAWGRPRPTPTEIVPSQTNPTMRHTHRDPNKHLTLPVPPPVPAAAIPPPPGMGKRKLYPSQDPRNKSARLDPKLLS